jgi:hypothetical protein
MCAALDARSLSSNQGGERKKVEMRFAHMKRVLTSDQRDGKPTPLVYSSIAGSGMKNHPTL